MGKTVGRLVKGEIRIDEAREVVIAICPICGAENECKFGDDGKLEWYPDSKRHCEHFVGIYSAGSVTLQALFKK